MLGDMGACVTAETQALNGDRLATLGNPRPKPLLTGGTYKGAYAVFNL